MELQCLIVEDEALAAEVLTDYISQVPFLSLAGYCSNAIKALEFLKKKEVDVLFLDLHLPWLKGFDLLKTLSHRPQVIITTAYHQYALQGYDWDVVDYLVKPIEFSRFLTAVNRLSFNKPGDGSAGKINFNDRPYLFVYSEKKQVKILLEDILYVESERDYLKIVLKEKNLIIRQTLQEFEKHLPSKFFIRVHRSFLVNQDAITAYDSAHVEIKGQSIPVGRQYRENVMNKLKISAN